MPPNRRNTYDIGYALQSKIPSMMKFKYMIFNRYVLVGGKESPYLSLYVSRRYLVFSLIVKKQT